MEPTVRVVGYPEDSPDAGECDFLCLVCGQTARIHPFEPFAPQVRVFLDQHRHDAESDAYDAEEANGDRR